MAIAALSFYVFAFITLFAAVNVIFTRNPVHSVLFLILAFFSSAGLFVLMGAEFLAMVLVIVYVGAVAVLFLFVVMMLDVNVASRGAGLARYASVGALVGGLLLVELVVFVGGRFGNLPDNAVAPVQPIPDMAIRTNTQALGDVLYTDYIVLFQTAGMILLVAMVGAIVLTLRKRPGVKRQDVRKQTLRRIDEAVELKKVEPGAGL
jgi:NADH-quinone oxidoreductase subunit J